MRGRGDRRVMSLYTFSVRDAISCQEYIFLISWWKSFGFTALRRRVEMACVVARIKSGLDGTRREYHPPRVWRKWSCEEAGLRGHRLLPLRPRIIHRTQLRQLRCRMPLSDLDEDIYLHRS